MARQANAARLSKYTRDKKSQQDRWNIWRKVQLTVTDSLAGFHCFHAQTDTSWGEKLIKYWICFCYKLKGPKELAGAFLGLFMDFTWLGHLYAPPNISCLRPMCYNSSNTSNVRWWSKTASNNSSVISFVIRAAGQSLIAISSQSNLQLKSAVMSPAGRMRPFFMYNGGRVMTERTDNDRRSRKRSKARELPHTRMSLWGIERENR